MHCSLRHLRFLGKLFSGVFPSSLRDSVGNSYCKKECNKVEAKVVEITHIRLQKMKKNVALTSSNKLQQVTEKEVTKTATFSTNYILNAGMTRVE